MPPIRLFRAAPAAALAALLLAQPLARADDTEEFLKPENWEGRQDIWKIDPKARTVTGDTQGDLKVNTFFCSKKKYGDFELTCKVLLKDAVGNSGIQIRSELIDAKGFVVKGPQVDVGQGYFGALYGERVGGYLVKPKKEVAKPKEFNEYKVVVKGNHVTVTLNGTVTVDQDFPDDKGKNVVPKEGIIAFQAHVGPKMHVEFKDIQFTDLSKGK